MFLTVTSSSSFSSVPLPNTSSEAMEQIFALGISSVDELVQCQKREGVCKTHLSLTFKVGARRASWGYVLIHTYQRERNEAIAAVHATWASPQHYYFDNKTI